MDDETNITKQTEVMDEFDLELERSAERHTAGQKANSWGKRLGLLLKKASGAESAKGRGDNLAAINSVPVRFHNAFGKHFSLNPETEAPSLVFATYKDKPTVDKPLHGRIYGLRLAECLKAGRRGKRGGTEKGSVSLPGVRKSGGTERVSVSLALVGKRVRLGDAFFPAKYIEADSPDHRMDLEDAIDKLTSEELETMMDAATREKIREFVLEGHEKLATATAPATLPPGEAVAPEVDQAPPEPASEGDAGGLQNVS